MYMGGKTGIKAIVLAAGEGTRMWPLTEHIPKHLLPLGGGRVLDYIIETLTKAGVGTIGVLVHWKKQRIMEYLYEKRYGADIRVIEQEDMLGTANAISYASELVNKGESFLAVNGDILITEEAVKRTIHALKALNSKDIGVLNTTVKESFERYGVVQSEEKDGIKYLTDIIEKPTRDTKKRLSARVDGVAINAGLYGFKSDIFSYIKKTHKSTRGEYEITDTLKLALKDGKNIRVVDYGPEWLELTYPWDLLKANSAVMADMKSNISGTVEEGVYIKGNVVVEKGAVVRSGVYMEGNIIIRSGSRVGPNAYLRGSTLIGKNCHVGASVEIKNSIIMDGANVPHHNYVGDSIIGEGCNLGSGTKVANLRLDEGEVRASVKGTVIPTGLRKLGVIMGNGVKTGINASLLPGTLIGPGTFVGPGAVASGTIGPKSRIH